MVSFQTRMGDSISPSARMFSSSCLRSSSVRGGICALNSGSMCNVCCFMQSSSRHLAEALCAVQNLQVLLCSAQVQPGFMRFAVLLVELRLFRNQFLALGFQLFQ